MRNLLNALALGGRLWLAGFAFGRWNRAAWGLRARGLSGAGWVVRWFALVPVVLLLDLLLLPLALVQAQAWGRSWPTGLPAGTANGVPLVGGCNVYLRWWAARRPPRLEHAQPRT